MTYAHTDAKMTPIKKAPNLEGMVKDCKREGQRGGHTYYPKTSLVERRSRIGGETADKVMVKDGGGYLSDWAIG